LEKKILLFDIEYRGGLSFLKGKNFQLVWLHFVFLPKQIL